MEKKEGIKVKRIVNFQEKKGFSHRRRLLTAVLSLCMTVSCYGGIMPVWAEEAKTTAYYNGAEYELHTSGDYQYIVIDKEAVIVKYTNTQSSIAIPSVLDRFPVTAIGYDALGWQRNDYQGAFEGNSSLQSVVIPESVELVDREAFRGCSGLQSILAGPGLKEIGISAFQDCAYMQRIQFTGDALQIIGEQAFRGDAALDEVVIPANVKTIADEAFRQCTALKSIRVPDSVTEFGEAAFAGCTSMEEAVIGNGVTKLEAKNRSYNKPLGTGSDGNMDGAFEGCTSLARVTIGNHVTEIGVDAFAHTGLEQIAIPDNVEMVCKGAFYNCDSMIKADTGNGVRTIELNAFWDCGGLEEVHIGKKVHSVGDEAFRCCTALKQIVIPSNVTELGAAAFAGCTSLESAVIGNGVRALQTKERTYDHPLSLGSNKGHDGAFEGCQSLKKVTIGNGVKSIDKDAFAATALTDIYIPDNVVTMGDGVFYDCDALEKAVIGDGVNTVGAYAFWDCGNLKEVEFGTGVVSIGEEAFRFCTALEELNLPSNITSVGAALCAGCTSLRKVVVGNGVTTLPHKERTYNKPLNTGSNKGHDGTFEGCILLNDVALGSGLTSIGTDAFANTKVSSVIIPRKVSSLGQGAFYSPEAGLSAIYFAGTAPEFGKELFGSSAAPAVYCLPGNKGSFDKTDYAFDVFTPVTVKFDSNGVLSTLASDQLLPPEGGYVIEPIPLAAENHLFRGWYADKECTIKWDFMRNKVNANTTLYAKWVKTSEALPEKVKLSEVFESTAATATIQWQPVSGAKSYKVYKDGTVAAVVEGTNCSYTLTGLERDSSYEVTVTAVNDIGESAQSLVKVVQTKEKAELVNGDLNGDEKVSLADAKMALAIVLKLYEPDESIRSAVNVDKNERIDLADVQLILKCALKIIDRI